jgi:hypothetical protein
VTPDAAVVVEAQPVRPEEPAPKPVLARPARRRSSPAA